MSVEEEVEAFAGGVVLDESLVAEACTIFVITSATDSGISSVESVPETRDRSGRESVLTHGIVVDDSITVEVGVRDVVGSAVVHGSTMSESTIVNFGVLRHTDTNRSEGSLVLIGIRDGWSKRSLEGILKEELLASDFCIVKF